MTSSLRELGHLFLSEWIWARLWKGGCKLVLQVSKRGKNGSSLLSAWMSALVNRQAVFLACSILSHLKAHLFLGMPLSQMRNEGETCPHFLSCPLCLTSPPSPLSPAVQACFFGRSQSLFGCTACSPILAPCTRVLLVIICSMKWIL